MEIPHSCAREGFIDLSQAYLAKGSCFVFSRKEIPNDKNITETGRSQVALLKVPVVLRPAECAQGPWVKPTVQLQGTTPAVTERVLQLSLSTS